MEASPPVSTFYLSGRIRIYLKRNQRRLQRASLPELKLRRKYPRECFLIFANVEIPFHQDTLLLPICFTIVFRYLEIIHTQYIDNIPLNTHREEIKNVNSIHFKIHIKLINSSYINIDP